MLLITPIQNTVLYAKEGYTSTRVVFDVLPTTFLHDVTFQIHLLRKQVSR